ncbi:LysR substrate-binding domain-containing protein [Achromobacter xylosoxidans]
MADSVAALTQMVAAGLGVSILPRMALDPAATAPRVAWRPWRLAGRGCPSACSPRIGLRPARWRRSSR